MRLVNPELAFKNSAMLYSFIRSLIIIILEDAIVPFDSKERVVEEVFDKNRGVSRFN